MRLPGESDCFLLDFDLSLLFIDKTTLCLIVLENIGWTWCPRKLARCKAEHQNEEGWEYVGAPVKRGEMATSAYGAPRRATIS